MPFIATCTFCRGSKFRVPFKKRGTFATCPKCSREFLLAPESGVDVPLMAYKHLPFEKEDEILDEPEASELVETSDASDLEPESTPEVAVGTVDVVSSPARPMPKDLPLRFALVAVALFGLAILVTLVPYGRLIAAPLALAGFALAAMGWLGLEKFAWLGATGAAINGLLVGALLAFPAWLGLDGWLPESDPLAGPKQALDVSKETGATRPAEWVDAATAVWEYGDVRIAIASVNVEQVGPAEKLSEKKKDRALRIAVKVENIGVARPLPPIEWHAPPDREVKLEAAGKPVPVQSAPSEPAMIYPGKSNVYILAFDLPEKADELRLELPGSAIGGAVPIRFRIPKAFVVGPRGS